jgi:DNA polymerase-3 subunit delta
MKLSTRDAAAYFKKPDPNASGCLIYGEDPVRVGQLRTGLVAHCSAQTQMRRCA